LFGSFGFIRTAMLESLKYFFRLGCLGFGGPLAAIAMMQKDLVMSRKWVEPEEFTRAFALIKVMPGPISFQMVIFLATRRAGRLAGVLSAIVFVLPAFCLMLILAWAQQTFTYSDWAKMLLRGFQCAALALIISSLQTISRPYWRDQLYWLLTFAALTGVLITNLPEPFFILLSGFTAIAYDLYRSKRKNLNELTTLFWVCFKAGSLVFGTGLAIVPLMQKDFVTQLHVAPEQFLNALAFGQVTPGPVVISASYLGFLTDGIWGAVVATLAIFLSSTVHMTTWFPVFFRRFGSHSLLISFTRGAIAAVSACILVYCVAAIRDSQIVASGLTIALLTLVPFMPAWLLVPIGAMVSAIIFGISGH
jgi:chromate transporter